jgi:hypothetical protein
MKVIKLDDNNSLKEALRIKKRGLREEDAGMNKFHMVYTVDGVKSEQDVSAANIMKAEELIRKQYDGKNIIFTSKQPVKENLREAYGYKVSYDDLIEIQGKIDRLIRKMADNHQDEISPSSNTYRIGLPFIGTSEGYIDLQNTNQYIEGHEDDWDDEDEDYDESLNEDKIADKIKSKQDPKEMTKKAIRMLKNLGGEYKDLVKEYKDTYGENPLDESLSEDYEYVKKAFAFDIYKDGNDYIVLDGDGDEVYRADNTLDCLKYAKKNSSKYYKADMSFDLDSWNNDFLHEDMESPEKVLEADEKVPQTEETVGLSNMIIKEINGEWETISNYNDLISLMRAEGQDDMINVISDIIDEEHKHVGQLQKCLQLISPNVSEIDSGETEAIEQLDVNDNLYADDSCLDCVDDDFGPNSGFDIYLV